MKKTILRRIRQKAYKLLKEQKIFDQEYFSNILKPPTSPFDLISKIPKPDKDQPYPFGNGIAVQCKNQQPPFELFYVVCQDDVSLGPQCQCEQYLVTADWICCDENDSFTNPGFTPYPGQSYAGDDSLFCMAAPGTPNTFANYKQALIDNAWIIYVSFEDWVADGLLNFQSGPGDIPITGTGYLSEECPGCMITQPAPLSGNNLDIANQQNMPDNLSMVHDGSCVFEWCNTPEADNYFCNSELASEDIEGINISFSDWCVPNKDGILVLDTAIGIVQEGELTECYVGGCTDNGTLTDEVWAAEYAGTTQTLGDGTGVLPEEYPGMPGADNYDPLATQDDGSCIYDEDGDGVFSFDEVDGCTDSTAFNYNETATEDDGTCVPIIYGCTDSLAFNFDEEANTLCEDPSNQINIDLNGDEEECVECIENLGGCTDESATNYDSLATFDDDSCCYNSGCTDINACNYSEAACNDDGSCEYDSCLGCTIPGFNGDATGNGAYSAANSTTLSIPTIDYCIHNGCLDGSQNEDGSYVYQNYVCNGDYAQFLCTSIDIDGDGVPDLGVPLSQESIDEYGLDMEPIGIFAQKEICQFAPILGCTNPDAENYNPDATEDDGTCEFIQGCMESTTADWSLEAGGYIVSNYQPDATQNFGCNYVVCLDGNADNYVCDAEDGVPYLCLQNTGDPNQDLDDDFIDSIGATIEDCNYSDQNIFDASDLSTCCFNIVPGCMQGGNTITNPQNLTADNYDPNANVECVDPPNQEDNDTGLPCEPCIFSGCPDPEACNSIVGTTTLAMLGYEAWVYNDDGSCEYPDTCNDCDGNYLTDGCTDDTACNYDPTAQCGPNEELCDYGCYGCTDEAAANYDELATMDDGSCEYDELCWDITIEQCNAWWLTYAYNIASEEGTRAPGGPAMWTNITLRCVSIGYPSAADEIGPNTPDGQFGGNPPFPIGTSPNGLGEYITYEGITADALGGPNPDFEGGSPYVPAFVCPDDSLPLGNQLLNMAYGDYNPQPVSGETNGGCCDSVMVHADSAGHPNVYTNAGTMNVPSYSGPLGTFPADTPGAALALCNTNSSCAGNVSTNNTKYCNGVLTTTIDFSDGSFEPDDDIIYNPPIDEGLVNEQADIPTGLGTYVDPGGPYFDISWGSDPDAIWKVISVSEPYSNTGDITYLPTATQQLCNEYADFKGPAGGSGDVTGGDADILGQSRIGSRFSTKPQKSLREDVKQTVKASKKLRKIIKSQFKK